MKKFLTPISLLFISIIFLNSCSKQSVSPPAAPSSGETISAKVAPGQSYRLNLGSSGSALINRQASHFQVSETSTAMEGGQLSYHYVPATDYTGSDEVTLTYRTETAVSTNTGGCTVSPNGTMVVNRNITIKITVGN